MSSKVTGAIIHTDMSDAVRFTIDAGQRPIPQEFWAIGDDIDEAIKICREAGRWAKARIKDARLGEGLLAIYTDDGPIDYSKAVDIYGELVPENEFCYLAKSDPITLIERVIDGKTTRFLTDAGLYLYPTAQLYPDAQTAGQ